MLHLTLNIIFWAVKLMRQKRSEFIINSQEGCLLGAVATGSQPRCRWMICYKSAFLRERLVPLHWRTDLELLAGMVVTLQQMLCCRHRMQLQEPQSHGAMMNSGYLSSTFYQWQRSVVLQNSFQHTSVSWLEQGHSLHWNGTKHPFNLLPIPFFICILLKKLMEQWPFVTAINVNMNLLCNYLSMGGVVVLLVGHRTSDL